MWHQGVSSFPETVYNCLHVPGLVWEQGYSNGETARLVWEEEDGVSLVLGAAYGLFHWQLGSLTLASY